VSFVKHHILFSCVTAEQSDVGTKGTEALNNATALVLMLAIISVPPCHQNKLLERTLARDVGCCMIHQRTNISLPVKIVEMVLFPTVLLKGIMFGRF
jgi:hypothetical protein